MGEVAPLLGVGLPKRCNWVRQAEADVGSRPGTTTEDSAGLKLLRRERSIARGRGF